MSNLWDHANMRGNDAIVVPGETVPRIFWNAAERRASQVWMREKELGIWRAWTWAQTAQAVREIAHGLMALGFERGETVSILSTTVV